MSDNIITEFITSLSACGLQPYNSSDIRSDNQRRNYRLHDDPPSKKRGYYILAANNAFGFGYFGDYRSAEHHPWHSRLEGSGHSAEQLKAWRKELEEQTRQQEAQRLLLQEERAREAQDRLLFLDMATEDHAYLTAKGVKPHGIYKEGENLLIPMIYDGIICNIQTIFPDGTKLFMPDARKQGTWFTIPGADDSIICVAEGYATAASIHEATGYTVIVGWDAYNLTAIAEHLRAKYPDSKIIFCADNDQFTKDCHGNLSNTGIIKATEAAEKINAYVCYPVFPDDETRKLTDYNDLHQASGMDAVLTSIGSAAMPLPDVATAGRAFSPYEYSHGDSGVQPSGGSEDWMKELVFKKDGSLSASSIQNALLYLRHESSLAGLFRFNEFKSEVFICRRAPWDGDDFAFPRRVSNSDLTCCEAYLEKLAGLRINSTRLLATIETCAEKHPFHPVRDYFDSLVWDGKERLSTWIRDYLCATEQNEQYLSDIGMKWMVAAAKRIYEPGCKFDHMLVLEGPQNAGKSYCLRILGTLQSDHENEDVYYTDAVTIGSIEERGSILKLQGKFIIEFPELAGLNKKDRDELKRWITLQTDEVEVKYQQFSRIMPRQFVLAGTYNPIPGVGWLTDPTGARRFWPVKTGSKIRLSELMRDKAQLWAEAVTLYKSGYAVHIDQDDRMNESLSHEHSQREEEDVWEDEIRRIIEDRAEWRSSEILEKMGIITSKQTRKESLRLANVMHRLDWSSKITRRNNQVIRCWCAPENHPANFKLTTNVLPLIQPRTAEILIDMESDEEIKW